MMSLSNFQNRDEPKKTTNIFPISIALGTGGMFTENNLMEYRKNLSSGFQIQIMADKREPQQLRSPADELKLIRESFALNMTQLADLFSVSRQAVYLWLQGQEPKPEHVKKVQCLAHIADEMQSYNIERIDALIQRPIFEGRSLLEKLKMNEDVSESLKVLSKISEKEKQARTAQKGSSKNLRSMNDVSDEYSSPTY